ncbi:MAG: DUF3179 domain-containing protein [Chloroflexi bacterium]|nr:DUF3179 domain-containing protein [Chloroflexota bacterium]
MIRRVAATAAILALLAVACSPGAGSAPTGSPAEPRPAETPDVEATPDVNRLRVSRDGWRTDFTRASVDLGEFLGGGPGKDGIPAIDEPAFESIADARTWLDDRSPVIRLEAGGEVRAYPIAILMWHEIVNDTLGGVPVVVTFCPLCNTGLVFERELDGVVHDFGTTGNLRYSDLVMYDRQTESWWQQATGQAIVGELTGSALRFLPSQIVSLGDVAAADPGADVLSRETGYVRDYGRNPYVGYDTLDQHPFLFDGETDGRLLPKERVVTIGDGASAQAFRYSDLRAVGVATAELDGVPIVVLWVPGTASALDAPNIDDGEDAGATGVFRPNAEGRALTLARDGDGESAPIRDAETGSTWAITGRAIDGPLAGAQLEPVVHGDHFWFAWAAFSPETTIWIAP